MKKLKLFALTAVALMGVSGVANAETTLLASDDFVGISFWLVSMALLASTAFFFIERASVPAGWRVSITVARTSYWYCIYSLHVHERCVGYDW